MSYSGHGGQTPDLNGDEPDRKDETWCLHDGQLIDDDALIVLLNDVISRNGEAPITFFELTTAAAFLAFATVEADACIIEVGLGGRMDATNIIPTALVTGIAQLGLDHTQWLGPTILDIAREKAGIARKGVPLVLVSGLHVLNLFNKL